jgi:hypothetical protein
MSSRTWRPIGSPGKPYPGWMQKLRKSSGVYAIRVIGMWTNKVVYVGESHSGRLTKTIARHFAAWGRSKSWWSGMFSGTDPGRTYDRGECEVCFETCEPSKAIALQDRWIKELYPRDNVQGADPDAVPF